jgi:hypothetical protein
MSPLREISPRSRSPSPIILWLASFCAPVYAHVTEGAAHPTARASTVVVSEMSAEAKSKPRAESDTPIAERSAAHAAQGGPTRGTPQPLPPNRWRAALEMALALGGGTAWYVIDDRNVLDWDRPSMRQRITGEAWRYDRNGPVINFLLHPLSGAAFYSLARGNRIGMAESFAYTVASSTAWEYVIEFKEKISINDMLVTPMGGLAIGAFADKLAHYLNDVPPLGAAHTAAQWILGPSIRLHRTLDGEPPPNGVARDRLGLAATFWHAFELRYEGGWIDQQGHSSWSVHDFAFNGTLASLPGYRRPGRFARWFYDADVSRLGFGMNWARSDAGGRLVTDTLLAGYHWQSLRGSSTTPHGVMWTMALGLGYRYRHTRAFGFDDREGIVGFPGPAFDLYAGSNALRAELSMRMNAEFAGQTSLAAPEWEQNHPGVRTKTVVEREGYFFGWGASFAAWAEAVAGPFWSRAHLRSGWYDSQEGLDRAQHRIEDDTEFHEMIREYGVSLGIELCKALRVGATHEVRHRLSTADSTSANQAAEHTGGLVQVAF